MAELRGNNDALLEHYQRVWGPVELAHPPLGGRAHELPSNYFVAEFVHRRANSQVWQASIFATVGASNSEGEGVEFFMMTQDNSARHAELVTCVAHYHLTGLSLGLSHVVNFGEPWMPGSACTYAYLSLPYAFGPQLEWLVTARRRTRCLWLVPITSAERTLLLTGGVEALEGEFDRLQPDLLNPTRDSVAK